MDGGQDTGDLYLGGYCPEPGESLPETTGKGAGGAPDWACCAWAAGEVCTLAAGRCPLRERSAAKPRAAVSPPPGRSPYSPKARHTHAP